MTMLIAPDQARARVDRVLPPSRRSPERVSRHGPGRGSGRASRSVSRPLPAAVSVPACGLVGGTVGWAGGWLVGFAVGSVVVVAAPRSRALVPRRHR